MSQVLPIAGAPPGQSSLIDGASNDNVVESVRRFLPPAYKNKPGWDALSAAFAAGDEIVRQNIADAFAQLFLSAATGNYLIQRAADQGITYPENAGISEELFRELAILLANERQIAKALLGILEVFYGYDSTRAHVVSAPGPYNLTAGDTLSVLVDGTLITITFDATDFANIDAATPDEVAAVLSRACYEAGSKGFALAKDVDGQECVVIYSGAIGLLGSIEVAGGMGYRQIGLGRNWIDTYVGDQWTGGLISTTEYKLMWTQTRAPGNLIDMQPGWYVTFDVATAPFLRGSYEVLDIHIDADPGTGSYANCSWFTFKPTSDFSAPPPTTFNVQAGEIAFFAHYRATVQNNTSPSFIAQHDSSGLDIVMPATTQAVGREADAAAYLHANDGYEVEEVYRGGGWLAIKLVGGITPFAFGDVVELQGVRGSPSGPSNGAGGWNQMGAVGTWPGAPLPPGFFAIEVPRMALNEGHGVGGYAYPVAAVADENVGPYLFDETDFSVTGTETTTSSPLAGGRGIGTLAVASTTGFLNEESWICIGFGTQYECGPIRCLGVIDGSNLAVDRSFVIPVEIPAGTSVTLLASKTGLRPETGSKAFTLTDSVAGRVAAEGFIDETAAAGIPVNKIIVYPGDRGLGGEGDPLTGIHLSDKVVVWASDDVDGAVKAAHDA